MEIGGAVRFMTSGGTSPSLPPTTVTRPLLALLLLVMLIIFLRCAAFRFLLSKIVGQMRHPVAGAYTTVFWTSSAAFRPISAPAVRASDTVPDGKDLCGRTRHP